MTTQHFILATAGHVDHGKSALIQALTGTDPDRLPEEKARGITIDLGFAHLDIPAPETAAPVTSYSVGIVDVPGHEDFVKNMVAGVGSIDAALLVVAADDGWMPQTEEHLQILTYLGVRRAVVALSKADLASVPLNEVMGDLRQRLLGSPFAQAPIVPTSVLDGQGLSALPNALAEILAERGPPPDIGKPRLPVDRAFTLPGIGTVVTGTLTGGTLRRGQAVVVQPSGRATRVRSLQQHHRDAAECGPAMRTAVNLPDLTLTTKARGAKPLEGVQRGDVITLPDLGEGSRWLDVRVEKSGRLAGAASPAARPLKDGSLLQMHHGSGHWPARIVFRDGRALHPGQTALAQLRLETPVFVFAGDRFILRDWSEQWTLGGGIVLDPDAPRSAFKKDSLRILLESWAAGPGDVRILALSRLRADQAVLEATLLKKSVFSTAAITQALDRLCQENAAVRVGEYVADAAWWQQVCQQAVNAIRAEHQSHPERPGLALDLLRRTIKESIVRNTLFPALLSSLGQRGFVQVGAAIRERSHQPTLPPALQPAGTRLRAALRAKPYEPPPKKELTAVPQGTQALRFLLETGEAVDLGADTIMHSESFTRAKEEIARFLSQHGPATASELRQLLKTNRRIIIPLLERLDREGFTKRLGDKRILCATS